MHVEIFKKLKIINFVLPIFLASFFLQNLYGTTVENDETNIFLETSKENFSQNFFFDLSQIDFSEITNAIQNSDFEILDSLFKNKKTNLNQNLGPIGNILHIAIYYNNLEALKFLICNYFDEIFSLIEAKNQEGQTPLMLAANLGNTSMISFLISKGANIEEKDFKGKTAFHWAVFGKQILSIEILSYLGANINAIDDYNFRAVDYLRNNKDEKSQNIIKIINDLNKQNEILKTAPPLYSFLPFENLVLEGGGAKGVALVGAIKELEDLNALIGLKRIAGTSAGAITAAFVAIGYHADEMLSILSNTDLTSFLDYYISEEKIKSLYEDSSVSTIFKDLANNFLKTFKNPITQIENFFNYFKNIFETDSLCSGEDFRKWIEQKIFEKTNIQYLTFKELRHLREKDNKFKHLHIFTTKAQPSLEIFRISSEDEKFDDVIISDAIRSSMSIPGVFQPHTLYIKDSQNNRIKKEDFGLFIDGGVLDNYPITAFDTLQYQTSSYTNDNKDFVTLNKRTLGLSLYSPKSQKQNPNEVTNIFDLGKTIMELFLKSEDLYHKLEPYDKYRTIKIDDIDVSTLEFQLSDELKKTLEESGKRATKKFFDEQQKRLESLNLIINSNEMQEIEANL